MYTLTEIGTDNVTSHDYLGYGFSVVNKEVAPDYFEKSYLAWMGIPDSKTIPPFNDDIYSFVVSEGGKHIFPLYKTLHYYIVTENGKTFKNLTFK